MGYVLLGTLWENIPSSFFDQHQVRIHTMDSGLLYIFVLLGLSAFFSGSETSLFSIPWWKLHKFRGKRKSLPLNACIKLCQIRTGVLVTILFGNTLVNVGASSLAEHYLEYHFPGNGLWLAIIVMTIVLIACR